MPHGITVEGVCVVAAAEKIPGMAQTWKGQYAQYEQEFDFNNESDNVVSGYNLYNIKDKPHHPLHAIAPDVTTVGISDLAATKKNVIVLDLVRGDTLDTFFKDAVSEIRTATASVFEQDPATGRVKWEAHEDPATHKTVKKPVLRQDIPASAVPNLQMWLVGNRDRLTTASDKLLQASKAWFYNALLGNGKFHGDPHAGNLLINNEHIGFIDFGNLYQLKREREDGVNEQHELMRVILGAAFRDKKFILGAFEKLMSAEGKARLADEKTRAKAEAILDSLLDPSRGKFSFNIVYRLQACIVELQKLGLELPPQINCFIQSLVRLSNNVTEINTIVNQADALLATASNLDRHADGAHNPLHQDPMGDLENSLAQFRTALQNAGDDAEAKAAAIRAFADAFALAECIVTQNIVISFQNNDGHEPPPPPNAFASAITDILFDNFTALREALGIIDGLAMYNDAKNVVANELHKDAGGPNRIIDAIKEDAQQAGGDKDYAIDIGV